MKFVSFSAQGVGRAGVLLGDGSGASDKVVDLAHPTMREALRGVAPQLQAMIEAGLPSRRLRRMAPTEGLCRY